MSKRSQQKRITPGARTLRFLREQAGMSIRKAGEKSGVNPSVIAHLEQGRIDIHVRHLEPLLKAYGSTVQTYQMFSSGGVALPQNVRAECIEIVRSMSLDQLKTAHPVLLSLSAHK
jgi:transcriptional regulator with XRE-family HTH domain